MIGCVHTGVKGGELKVGVGSRVERAGAPVSPRGSAPRPLDLRRGRDMGFLFSLSSGWMKSVVRGKLSVFYEARALYELKMIGGILYRLYRLS